MTHSGDFAIIKQYLKNILKQSIDIWDEYMSLLNNFKSMQERYAEIAPILATGEQLLTQFGPIEKLSKERLIELNTESYSIRTEFKKCVLNIKRKMLEMNILADFMKSIDSGDFSDSIDFIDSSEESPEKIAENNFLEIVEKFYISHNLSSYVKYALINRSMSYNDLVYMTSGAIVYITREKISEVRPSIELEFQTTIGFIREQISQVDIYIQKMIRV